MSDLGDLLAPATVVAEQGVAGRKALFALIGTHAAIAHGLDAAHVAERLAERERLGSTGFGGGVALPHAKLAGLPAVTGVFVRVQPAIDFAAVDHLPVDIVFALLSPLDAGAQHLKALARVSRRMRDRAFVEKLRGAGSADALYVLLAGDETRDAA